MCHMHLSFLPPPEQENMGTSLLEYFSESQIQTHCAKVLTEAKNSEWGPPPLFCLPLIEAACAAAARWVAGWLLKNKRPYLPALCSRLPLPATALACRRSCCPALTAGACAPPAPAARGQPKQQQPAFDPFGLGQEAESDCRICERARLTFEPPSLYCFGCGQRIKRNQVRGGRGGPAGRVPVVARKFGALAAATTGKGGMRGCSCRHRRCTPTPRLPKTALSRLRAARCTTAHPPRTRSRAFGATPATRRSRPRRSVSGSFFECMDESCNSLGWAARRRRRRGGGAAGPRRGPSCMWAALKSRFVTVASCVPPQPQVPLDGFNIRKAEMEKRKNDDEARRAALRCAVLRLLCLLCCAVHVPGGCRLLHPARGPFLTLPAAVASSAPAPTRRWRRGGCSATSARGGCTRSAACSTRGATTRTAATSALCACAMVRVRGRPKRCCVQLEDSAA